MALGGLRQRTLKSAIGCTGVGLHGGVKVSMTLRPAEARTGIVFRRVDRGGVEVRATADNVESTTMCTRLGGGVGVGTVEHLMAAFAGLGIDNAVVELDGPEVPIMDGSSAPFVFLIECAGIATQAAPRRAIRVLKTVMIDDGARYVGLSPSDGFSAAIEIAYAHPLIGRQRCEITLVDGVFKRELCRARTYGFLRDVDRLRAMGLALGGSLENAVVLDDEQVMNEGGLRYDDELVRHKVLDCIGDLYLAGAPILGHVEGLSSGHAMNLRLLKALFADLDAWCWETIGETTPAMPRWRAEPVAATA